MDLFGGLLQVCKDRQISTCEVRALGSLETVELAEYDQATKTWKPARKFAGGFEVLNLTGNVSEKDGQLALHVHASLMRDRDSGVEMLGGHVVAGRIFALEFVLETFDDLLLRRGVDEMTGLTLWREAVQLPPGAGPGAGTTGTGTTGSGTGASAGAGITAPAPLSANPPSRSTSAPLPPAARLVPVAPPTATTLVSGSGWADVAAASAQKPPAIENPPEDESLVTVGDVIEHAKLGRGEVQRLEGSGEFLHVRLSSGRLVRLSLDVLKLTLTGRDGKKRVFSATVI